MLDFWFKNYGKICIPLFGVIFLSKNNPTYLNKLFCNISNTHLIQTTGNFMAHLMYTNRLHIHIWIGNLKMCQATGIISYFHHPLKDIDFRAAAGLMTCLKALDFFHTNLFNPMQALPTMKLLFLYLNNKFGLETVFHCL